MTPPAPTEALRLLIDDHQPAHLRLPTDFLVWTGAGERIGPELHLCAEREVRDHRQTEAQTLLERLTR